MVTAWCRVFSSCAVLTFEISYNHIPTLQAGVSRLCYCHTNITCRNGSVKDYKLLGTSMHVTDRSLGLVFTQTHSMVDVMDTEAIESKETDLGKRHKSQTMGSTKFREKLGTCQGNR